ncbi:MAG: tetraacyldisaccharide 4'-kinase [Spirochaetes bacterium]|nr:tetraacyldisaccharide 4'-kinase [Spirochaetota bacterium]
MEKIFKKVIYQYKHNILYRLIFYGLVMLSFIYKMIVVHKRKKGYDKQGFKGFIISIGNLTTGGTGKTPFAIFLAKKLSKHYRVCIIMRGYRGRYNRKPLLLKKPFSHSYKNVGDEPLLIARKTGLPVIISRDRLKALRLAEKVLAPDIVILDDAFQHFAIKRDMNIVLIDYFNPFGNGYLIPAGILREPLEALKQASVIIITKCDNRKTSSCSLTELKSKIKQYNPRALLFTSDFLLDGFTQKGKTVSAASLKKKRMCLISALGNPDYFEFLVKKYLAPSDLCHVIYPDHHFYNRNDIDTIRARPYDVFLTTDKDYIKLDRTGLWPIVFHVKFNLKDETKFLRYLNHEIKNH